MTEEKQKIINCNNNKKITQNRYQHKYIQILHVQSQQFLFNLKIYIITQCEFFMMKSTPELAYNGQIDTHQEVKELFPNISLQDRQILCNDISPVLYQFHAMYQNVESTVFRTHDEIVKFLKKYNKKAKQLKEPSSLNFQKIKNHDILKQISYLKNIAEQDWFQQFFDLDHNIPGKKISLNLKKQSGGRYTQRKCCLCLKWKKCRGYILNEGLVTYDQSRNKIQQFLHFGKDFIWQISPQVKENVVYIYSNHRKMSLSAPNTKQFFLFTYCLDKYLKAYNKQQQEYPYNSFAPIRFHNQVEFFVDGAEYFQALALAIQSATEEVFICGWWVSPQFSLIRPCTGTNLDYRLDKLLARTAKKGVKIYIIVYYESSFLSNDSTYTIEALQVLHSNIKVLRHPQIVFPTFWSHHEKLIVIDQNRAFLGGLDICYGRFDNQLHLINQSSPDFYPGIQYNNCRIADFIEVRQFNRQNVPRHLPRLPWHDVTLMVRGKCVKDLSRHFIEYWNHASYQTHFADRYVLVSQSNKLIPKKKGGLLQNIKDLANQFKQKIGTAQKPKNTNINRDNHNHNHRDTRQSDKNLKKIDTVKQYNEKNERNQQKQKSFTFVNPFSKFFQSKTSDHQNHIIEQQINEVMVGRKQSPSNEILYNLGEKRGRSIIEVDQIDFDLKKQKQQQQFIIEEEQFEEKQHDRIKRTQQFQLKRINEMKKIETQIEQQDDQINQEVQKQYIQEKQKKVGEPRTNSMRFLNKAKTITQKIFNRASKPSEYEQKKSVMFKEEEGQNFTCQVLRSASTWSIGCKQYQKSIQQAYISLIEESKKFIYIENQFFISSTHEKSAVKNKVIQALSKRIIKAIGSKQNFKVMVLMPLIPGFAGELDDPAASLPRVIMNWQYKTICRGEGSLIGRISQYTNQPERYVQFYGLRTHGLINDQPVTQIIYLHSKLMIIDDRYLICGSANINDRSMQGNRDSELCVLVQGNNQKDILIGKQKFKVVEKIHSLRTRLWEEHFGIPEFKARNFVDEELWWQLNKIANENTQIYRKIFGCYPDNEIKNLIDIKAFKKPKFQKKIYDQQAYKIQGHAVIFPLKFLENEKLTSYHPNAIST